MCRRFVVPIALGRERLLRHAGLIEDRLHQIAGIDVRSLVNRQGIDNSIEGGANIQLAKDIFGRLVGALGFGLLRLNAIHLGLRITLPLLLLQQFQIGVCRSKLILRLLYFAGRSCAVLLQAL